MEKALNENSGTLECVNEVVQASVVPLFKGSVILMTSKLPESSPILQLQPFSPQAPLSQAESSWADWQQQTLSQIPI